MKYDKMNNGEELDDEPMPRVQHCQATNSKEPFFYVYALLHILYFCLIHTVLCYMYFLYRILCRLRSEVGDVYSRIMCHSNYIEITLRTWLL